MTFDCQGRKSASYRARAFVLECWNNHVTASTPAIDQPITAWSHQNNGGLAERTDPTPVGETFDTFW